MKRLHLHITVENLEASIRFYTAMLGIGPTKQKPDYAKWMIEDPRMNLAISTRGERSGLDHLGLQVDSLDELETLRKQMKSADLSLFDEGETTCCYANSDKSWVKDPDGIPWEAYHTMEDAQIFSLNSPSADASNEENSCCSPSLMSIGASGGCDSTKK